MRVGFVGLGNIGKPMALQLAASSYELVVHDLVPEPVAELVQAGATAAGSVAELAASVDLVSVMVRDDDQVRQVLGEVIGSGRDGLVVAIHSTVAPDTPGELEEIASRHGIRVVDAPVSGGAMGAREGALAVMVGGSDDAFTLVAGPFAAMGNQVVHAGPVGSGTRMKLARNLLHFVAFTAATEAQRLAEAAGVDLVALGEVVRHTDAITGGPGAIMHRTTAARMSPDDPWSAIFEPVAILGEKDLRFAAELADQLGVEVPLTRLALDWLAIGLGLPPRASSVGGTG